MTVTPRENDNQIASPCIRNCCLDDEDICMGCYRSLAEIIGWHQADEDEKKKFWKRLLFAEVIKRSNDKITRSFHELKRSGYDKNTTCRYQN